MSEAAHDAPLAGLRVVVTRAEEQSAGLAAALAAAGATVEPLPLLAVLPPRDRQPLAMAAADLGRYRWVVFTSANAVRAVLPLLAGPWPSAVAVAAVGPATALALARAGVPLRLQAAAARAEGVLAALQPELAPGDRVLLPQAEDAQPVLAAGLRECGARVDQPVAYRKEVPPGAAALAARLFGDDAALGWVTFTSPSIVESFASLFGDRWPGRRSSLLAAAIGPVTAAALRQRGVRPAAEAARPEDQGLVAAIAAAVACRRSPPAEQR